MLVSKRAEKIILVVGEVTARQYALPRFDVFIAGYAPKIVRTTPAKLLVDDSDHREAAAENGADAQSVANEYAAAFGDVAALVLDEATWDHWSYVEYDCTKSAFDTCHPKHVVWVVRASGLVEHIG